MHGHTGVRQVLEPFFAPIHENEFSVVRRRAASGPVVFLERLDRHRLDHGWRELPVNSVFEVQDGAPDLFGGWPIHTADEARG